ncbi:zinc finger E-box-binding homeobox 1 [Thunnus albacares]|uniref:zinc finger E-box-binding homeobox 1 n=1 Tax=Thunnus maccoyii TaxID=8240 RepID=UPI001C4B29DD|nr:zinc finger E-box-binding homeobox 1 [Thunnus maccoyii]XP_042279704.1 zinc finger E-box-binding homeobox 1 [Thunnus maccoyii]XP_042279705.1 zinc finger E-box-binding homeobox 1 [Thunnus maccoyii]XP_042279706.1 zinc finger E-box-binding homeobox 1 [Thunnus maccoyii]XP_044215691.1 zinc finger E-box-binding homeobox 1 [Thunnus albacares]XP_044215692.1 zinc finger E-box-binding homeobox 1 [Thunnus albacares]XP_044215693.1 zinc finger E-box-binding homeobox 1 [Thunnus albacares]XP_044215694.1 
MDSQLATVLTSGSLDVQNGSQCAEGSGPVTEVFLDPKEKTSPSTLAGNLQPCPVKAVTIRQDALSINGKKPEVGGTSKPASQETSKIGGFRQPITVKTGVPVLRSQPIRIKIVVPPRCKRPITNSTISLTKDFARSHFRRPVLISAGAVITEENSGKIQISAVKNEGEIKEVTHQKTEAESFHGTEAQRGEKRDVLDAKIIHTDGSETPFISNTNTVKILSWQGIKEESAERELEKNIPLILQEMDLKSCKKFDEVRMEEQTEPLDLSLPKKRESRGRFLDDSVCESSLIMEVDEYEGEGDRDIVEEDDGEDSVYCMGGTDTLEDSLLSPSFFSTSVFTSLSSIDCDTENLLLIDDQGIPYTLSSDGLKVPQVDASTSEDPQSDQANPAEVERKGSSQLAMLAGPSHSQSLDNALNAPSDDIYPSPAPATDSPSLGVDQTKAPEVFMSLITNSDSSKASEPCKSVQEPKAALSQPSGISVSSQPIQILTNSSTNAPILLLSSSSSSTQLSSAPVGLSLPLSVTQTSPGASAPMFLLLSSVTSSSGDSASTSTPIAVLDPTTGQLSQITADSASVSLPLPSGQVSTLGSPLPTLSQPVIRLSPNNPPVILSGVNNVNSSSVLTSLAVPSPAPALQNNHLNTSGGALIHTQINSSDSNLGTEAISAEEVSNENNKPSTFTAAASSPHTQCAAGLTYDPLAQPSSEAEAQSPASEPKFDPSDLQSEHLPLEDHIYFSSAAAPSSPLIGPILPSGKLDPLDPLDPLSPAASPNAMSSRRVLYCQLCPRVFFYLSDLERHAITHSQKKPHVCQQCGKAFKRSSHLQRHKHIHTGQRNFVCPICAKRFREAGELQRHQRVHTGEKPYQCQLCHTRFAERNTLRRHTKRKHPYHQVAMEMLSERRDRGGCRGDGGGGGSGVQEEEESAEWYSSTVSNLDNSESEMET